MFRTEIPLTPDPRQLARTARVLTLGSCFADSMGSRLAAHKVPTLVNPFGTVFNPLSAALLLRAAAGEPADWSQHLVEARGRWQSYDLHGSIGADSAEALLARIQELVRQTADFVRTADVLALTLGTAWAYRLRDTGELVSNCHKMPASLFEKELLTTEEVVGQLAEVHALLRRLNPRLRLVLTVSPVRHLRDTLPLNSVSKSVLRLASHYLSELLPDVSYFPAYELLTDDLRDYRFYAADMLHPSAVAEDYIWERFVGTYFDAEFGRFRKEWEGIQQALAHRPLHAGAPEHRQFLESTLDKLRRLAGQQVDVRAEIRDVERRLLALPPPPRSKPAAAPAPEDDGEERVDIGLPETAELTPETSEAEQPTAPAGRNEAAESQPDAEDEAPYEGRARRGRGRPNRRNQGKGQRESNQVMAEAQAPSGQVLPAVASVAAPPPAKPSYTDYLISSAPELVTTAPTREVAAPTAPEPSAGSEASLGGEPSAEPVKKKKRRSRGGAKRTARKNAARLAAEQAGEAAASDSLPPSAEARPANEAAPTAEGQVEIDELAPISESTPDQAATDAAPLTLAAGADPLPADEAADEAEPEAAPPAAPAKKRGTGPGAKKSKVIAKSVPVKRTGQRGTAPARPAPAAAAPATGPDATGAAELPPPAPRPEPTPTQPAPAAGPAITDSPAAPAPAEAAEAPRPAPAKRASAAKPAKPKAAPAKAAAKAPKAAPAPARRSRKPTPDAAPAPNSEADLPAAAAPPAAPDQTGQDGEAPARRRGRPPGTKKARPDEPAAG